MGKLRSTSFGSQFAGAFGIAGLVGGGILFIRGVHTFYFSFLAATEDATGWFAWDSYGSVRLLAGAALLYFGGRIFGYRLRREHLGPTERKRELQSWQRRILHALAIPSETGGTRCVCSGCSAWFPRPRAIMIVRKHLGYK